MKTMTFLVMIVASLYLSTAAWGQQALSNAEVQQIVQKVTSQPRKTWISVGTMTATHQEYGAPKTTDEATVRGEIDKAVQQYQNSSTKNEKTAELQKMKRDAIPFNVRCKLSNEYAMSSTVTAKYDNGQFYWQIKVNSRQDSVKPDATLAGNYMTEQFNLTWNQRRIFTWDGQEYTAYSASGNEAIVDAADKLPHVVTGPLTAGLIAWGYGRFSSDVLAAAQIAAQRNADGTIDMIIVRDDGSSARLTLDPAKAYAVTKATRTYGGGATVTSTCSGYRQVAGNWVPSAVTIERKNDNFDNKLPTSEQWTFTSVSAAAPTPDAFRVSLAPNALVEYSSPVAAASAIYVQSNTIDTRGLLAQRLAYAAGEGLRRQNCATAAVQEVASEFGKSISGDALAGLVAPDGRTSMYDMKRLAESQGLFCQAVKADLATLRTLPGVKAILHIPGKDHFVVLSEIDDHNVWLVDLSNKKFCYRQSVDSLPVSWSKGAILLLSDQPIPGQSGALSDAALATLAGGSGWACNDLLQDYFASYCHLSFGCSGAVVAYYQRWGCGPADSGTCVDTPMVRSIESPCGYDEDFDCTVSGDWYYNYMLACQ
jgi:hypothetical protein